MQLFPGFCRAFGICRLLLFHRDCGVTHLTGIKNKTLLHARFIAGRRRKPLQQIDWISRTACHLFVLEQGAGVPALIAAKPDLYDLAAPRVSQLHMHVAEAFRICEHRMQNRDGL